MSESFSVGEIAIEIDTGNEVVITATTPTRCKCRVPGQRYESADGYCYAAHMLRKRRPPQDWVKLCNLTDTPRTLETA